MRHAKMGEAAIPEKYRLNLFTIPKAESAKLHFTMQKFLTQTFHPIE